MSKQSDNEQVMTKNLSSSTFWRKSSHQGDLNTSIINVWPWSFFALFLFPFSSHSMEISETKWCWPCRYEYDAHAPQRMNHQTPIIVTLCSHSGQWSPTHSLVMPKRKTNMFFLTSESLKIKPTGTWTICDDNMRTGTSTWEAVYSIATVS